MRPPSFTSRARDERATALLGIAVGVLFGVCLLSGLVSHLIQRPPGWFAWPSRPVWLYRWSQGLHMVAGLALVPVLMAKLWSAYPKLFRGRRSAASPTRSSGRRSCPCSAGRCCCWPPG